MSVGAGSIARAARTAGKKNGAVPEAETGVEAGTVMEGNDPAVAPETADGVGTETVSEAGADVKPQASDSAEAETGAGQAAEPKSGTGEEATEPKAKKDEREKEAEPATKTDAGEAEPKPKAGTGKRKRTSAAETITEGKETAVSGTGKKTKAANRKKETMAAEGKKAGGRKGKSVKKETPEIKSPAEMTGELISGKAADKSSDDKEKQKKSEKHKKSETPKKPGTNASENTGVHVTYGIGQQLPTYLL